MPKQLCIFKVMYKDFYSLKESPFNITADPDFFFASSRHEEAFNHLVYGIRSRRGIIVVTGEIGTGKTTLCRTILSRLDQTVKTALILNPVFSDMQLLQMIINDLGISYVKKTKLDLVGAITLFLIEESAKGNNVVVVIDECQNLNIRQLEQIRLLSNLETEKEKLLQIILVGQPELGEKLKSPSLRQLTQRVSVHYHILPLLKNEIEGYINHRLKIAGADPRLKFTLQAVEAVYAISQGTPRVINILCDRALLAGFAKETFTIDHSLVHESARETQYTYEHH
ncbi:MAG: AAA family ATPase [Candidatus Omnitrophica bacterium]|nr:AAA family ATPase [Candidatus Omnitrophota bacterium]MDE2010174.1 AAA family ATPase [Candidatus Omnitrophota bacterium]MDE2214908.1 AAA family ATPase [Candidatus Omnitrophota bacterium]MDE2230762.1 AAA family ATPase [Candidatus Omnitrophota bacterium]